MEDNCTTTTSINNNSRKVARGDDERLVLCERALGLAAPHQLLKLWATIVADWSTWGEQRVVRREKSTRTSAACPPPPAPPRASCPQHDAPPTLLDKGRQDVVARRKAVAVDRALDFAALLQHAKMMRLLAQQLFQLRVHCCVYVPSSLEVEQKEPDRCWLMSSAALRANFRLSLGCVRESAKCTRTPSSQRPP